MVSSVGIFFGTTNARLPVFRGKMAKFFEALSAVAASIACIACDSRTLNISTWSNRPSAVRAAPRRPYREVVHAVDLAKGAGFEIVG